MPPGNSDNSSARVDLHVHSSWSADGESGVGDYAQRAAAQGFRGVGFCEHVDLDPRDQDYGFLDMARYDQEITNARTVEPQVTLYQGVELSYQSRREDEIHAWLATRGWDYVVSSVHLVDYADGWAIVSEPSTTGTYFASHNQRQAYGPYFEELYRAARSGLGDVIGHFDLVKRYGVRQYGPFEPTDFQEEILAVLRAAIDSGMGLEINTSGLRQSPGEPYPGLTILQWYHELGGEILTLGSDTHHTDSLGAGLAQAQDLAQAAGFRAITVFERRKVRWIDL
jgi:histidinol-phosphatase (PHP family)